MTNHQLTVSAERVTIDIDGWGRYTSTRENYEARLSGPRAALVARFADVHDGERDKRTVCAWFRRQPRHVQAAMVAEWDVAS